MTDGHMELNAKKNVDTVVTSTSVPTSMERVRLDVVLVIKGTCVNHVIIYFYDPWVNE